jgi:DNA gyrase subunit A
VTKKNGSSIIKVKQIPYLVTIGPRIVPGSTTTEGGLINSIVDKIKTDKNSNGVIEGISDIQDHSDKNDIEIDIHVKKDYDPNIILAQLYKYTKLESSYKIQLVCLNNGSFDVYNIKRILEEFLEFRRATIRRTIIFDINKFQRRIHILEGLILALSNIDDVVKIIRASADTKIAASKLKKRLPSLTTVQIDYILDMKLSTLTGLEINKLKDERTDKLNKVNEFIEDLKPENIDKRIIEEQEEYKKTYGTPVKTEYMDIDTNITIEDTIEKEDCVVILSKDNYIKRLSPNTFKTQNRNTQGNNLSIAVKDIFTTNTKDHLMCFTNTGRVFDIKVYQIPESNLKSKGTKLPINLKKDEKVVKILCLSDEQLNKEDSYLIFVTKNGICKKTSLEDFNNINSSGLIAIKLNDGDKLVFTGLIDTEKDIQDIIIASSTGNTVRYNHEEFKPMGRVTMGLTAMYLPEDDYIASACIIDSLNDKVFFVTSQGLGKTTLITDIVKKKNNGKIATINDGFPRLKRTSNIKGRIGIELKDNDTLLDILPIHEEEEVKDLIITTCNKVLTISTNDFLKPLKRTTCGKKLINLAEEDHIVNVALR